MKSVNAPRVLAAVAAAFAMAGLAACDRGERLGQANAPDASAVTVNKPAAAPTGDPPGTTPVDKGTTTISKGSETTNMPHEGDNHSYSSVATDNPQKPGAVDAQQTQERTRQ